MSTYALVVISPSHPALDSVNLLQVRREHEGAEHVVGHARARVAKDLRVSGLEPELASTMLSVLWQTNIGAFAEDFLQLTRGQANALRAWIDVGTPDAAIARRTGRGDPRHEWKERICACLGPTDGVAPGPTGASTSRPGAFHRPSAR